MEDNMAVKTRNGNGSLAAAIALLVQNEAAFLARQVKFQDDLAKTRLAFARMEKDIETIKSILARHEATLERLADTIRNKIGFKRQ